MFGWMLHPNRHVSKRVFEKAKQWYCRIVNAGLMQMSDKLDKHKIQELREMVKAKAPDQPVEKVLAIFCERHGLTSGTCKYYYNILVENGDIKEK
jgi:hypothetical protein